MHNGVVLNNDIDVNSINKYKVESNTNIKAQSINETSKYFNNLTSKEVITIDESGSYYINFENSSSFMDIEIKNNSNVKLYLYYKNDNMFIENLNITVSENSSAYVLIVDELNASQSVRKAIVKKDCRLDLSIASFNVNETGNIATIDLEEEGAIGNLKVISLVKGNTFNKYDTTVNNLAPKTEGDLWLKAVALDGGRNEFLATGHIAKNCDDAKNFQESRVLLLDNAASGDASPLLLIEHYNVEAGHAAGVSRVNEDELYYLQSRGIDKQEAEHLITLAFVRPLIDSIEDEAIAEYIFKLVKKIVEVE